MSFCVSPENNDSAARYFLVIKYKLMEVFENECTVFLMRGIARNIMLRAPLISREILSTKPY